MNRLLQFVAILHICFCVANAAWNTCVCNPDIKHCICSGMNKTTIPDEKEVPNDTITLDLSENLLTKLDANSFARFNNLSTLSLGMNQIAKVDKAAFAKCENLTSLCLGMNAIAELDKATFKNVPLENLTLAWNNFSVIPDPALETLKDLKKLDLSFLNNNSDIVNISITEAPACLAAMTKLEELSIAGLGYKNMSMAYLAAASNKLLMVNMSHNKIAHVDGGSTDGLALQHLDVSHNLMTGLAQDYFHGMSNLETLDASYNKLNTLKDGPFQKMAKLLKLSLSDNRLSSLPSNAFEGLGKLTDLDLANNQFKSFPKTICAKATSVTQLNMDGFKGSSLSSDSLTSCKATLAVFSMRSSSIVDFGMAFADLPKLTDLDLSSNANLKLNNKDAFQNATALTTLNLSAMATKMSSNFYVLPEAITSVPKLTTLDISHSRFAAFTKNNTAFFQSKLQHLHATHNPYDCACKHLDFILWYQDTGKSAMIAKDDRHAYNCSTCDYDCGALPTPLGNFTVTHCDTSGGANHDKLVKYAVGLSLCGFVVGILLTSLVVYGLNKKRAMCFKGSVPYANLDSSTNA